MGASILARITEKVKIIILGNVLPIWDDPLWLAEQLSMIDMISHGRLVSGFVRGGGRESWSHNSPPNFNRERFEEAHDLIIKAWTEPGPWRWEGKHFHYRYVNPWAKPLQEPHPQIWIPSTVSVETVKWCAEHRYPLVLLATRLEPTREAFQLYHDTAAECGYESGTQNVAYLWKVHVDETEELAEEVGSKYLSGVSNPFLAGNEGGINPAIMNLPGHTSRTSRRLSAAAFGPAGRFGTNRRPFEDQVADSTIITGTPKTVIPKIREVLEYLRPGSVFFWDGDGAMTHEDQMRSPAGSWARKSSPPSAKWARSWSSTPPSRWTRAPTSPSWTAPPPPKPQPPRLTSVRHTAATHVGANNYSPLRIFIWTLTSQTKARRTIGCRRQIQPAQRH